MGVEVAVSHTKIMMILVSKGGYVINESLLSVNDPIEMHLVLQKTITPNKQKPTIANSREKR